MAMTKTNIGANNHRKNNQGRVLIIAGSDSSGGAGIQADMKTCAAFGAYSATAITAVTAQNSLGVQQIELMPAELVRAQIDSVLSDIGADIIKIGMLGSAAIIETVTEAVKESDALIVFDPVMVATSGDCLLGQGKIDEAALELVKTELIPHVDILTPNISEAALLTGLSITEPQDLSTAGQVLLEMGLYAVLMKGGHLNGKTIIDVLVSDEGASLLTGPRIYSRHTHGTGCTLASAVAAGLSLGSPLEEAVMAARDFVYEAIRSAPGFGAGHGPLNHGLAICADIKATDPATDSPFAGLKDMGKA